MKGGGPTARPPHAPLRARFEGSLTQAEGLRSGLMSQQGITQSFSKERHPELPAGFQDLPGDPWAPLSGGV